MAAYARHQSAIGRIMEIFGLLAHTIHAMILEVALDTSQAWSLVAYESQFTPTHRIHVCCFHTHHMSSVRADRQSMLSWPSSSLVSGDP